MTDGGDGEGGGRDGGGSGTMRSGNGDGRFTWKTLEEETRELMKQLERLRLQEVTKVKAVIVRAKEEHAKNLLRADKKKAVLTGQIAALEGAKPAVEAHLASFLEENERSRGEVEVLIANAREEARLIEALKNQQVENREGAERVAFAVVFT